MSLCDVNDNPSPDHRGDSDHPQAAGNTKFQGHPPLQPIQAANKHTIDRVAYKTRFLKNKQENQQFGGWKDKVLVGGCLLGARFLVTEAVSPGGGRGDRLLGWV